VGRLPYAKRELAARGNADAWWDAKSAFSSGAWALSWRMQDAAKRFLGLLLAQLRVRALTTNAHRKRR
jgi:hypothetical protein